MTIVYLMVMTVMVGGDHSIPDGDDCDGGR